MSFQSVLTTGLNYDEYRWGRSRQVFRGPKPDLSQPYVACIGGSETYGRFAMSPWPAQLERLIEYPCANWGSPGAGPTFFLKDPVVLEACSNARACVITVMGAHVTSNRLFSVFVRRNLRLRDVSETMRALYPEIDFSDFRFAANMLIACWKTSPERFKVVQIELRQAWVARMKELIADIETPTILCWLSDTSPEMAERMDPLNARENPPSYVDRDMIEEIKPHVDYYVEYVASSEAAHGPRIAGRQRPEVARRCPSDMMHAEAAELLSDPVSKVLGLRFL